MLLSKHPLKGTLEKFGVNDRDGELFVEINDDQYGEALYDFVQGLIRITNITYLSKDTTRIPFLTEFKDLIAEAVPENRYQFDWHDENQAPNSKYSVDCRVNRMATPLMIFAIPSDRKALSSTVTILQFEKCKIPFFPIGIFKEMDKITPKIVSKFSDVCQKTYSNIEEKETGDRIVSFIRKKAGIR